MFTVMSELFQANLLIYLSQSAIIQSLQVGYSNGDRIRYYQHPSSLTANIRNIYTQSNVGVPGRFVYHVGGNTAGAWRNSTALTQYLVITT